MGFFEGFQAAKQQKSIEKQQELAQAQLKLAQREQNRKDLMLHTQMQEAQSARERQKAITMAAKEGGFGGVLELLENTDPESAIALRKEKADLDSKLLANEKDNIGLAITKDEMLHKKYSMVGQIGYELNALPEEEKAAAYKRMLPHLKKILPDAPEEYGEDAKAAFLLAQGVATPANLQFEQKQVKTELGKLVMDKRKLTEEGADPEDVEALNATIIAKKLEAINKSMLAQKGEFDKDRTAAEGALLGKFLANTKDYRAITKSYNRILAALEDPSPAGDIALVFNYMKMLDPQSVVRESEYATAENARGVPARIRAQYNKALSGVGLDANQREDFASTARKMMQSQMSDFTAFKDGIKEIAKRSGLNPENVTLAYSEKEDPIQKLKAQAKEVIAKGANPDEVKADLDKRLEALRRDINA